jgi:hypothetical protein
MRISVSRISKYDMYIIPDYNVHNNYDVGIFHVENTCMTAIFN